MRIVLTFAVLGCVLGACAPRYHPAPAGEAPYLLHVPAPGSDYRYRRGPQGFGRTGPVHVPAPYPQPYGYAPYAEPGVYYGQPSPYPDYSDSYGWSDRRASARGGYAYESREMMTEETWVGGGVIRERAPLRMPHRPAPDDAYPGPYAEAPRHAPPIPRSEPIPYQAAPAYPGPYQQAPYEPEYRAPSTPGPAPSRPPWPAAGPEPFY